MTIGLKHTMAMRDAVRDHLDRPAELALAFDAATEADVRPWHEATAATRPRPDRRAARGDRRRHARARRPTRRSPPRSANAAATDEDALRWFVEMLTCLALPMEVMSRPGVFERVLELAADPQPPPPYGPDRRELLELIA